MKRGWEYDFGHRIQPKRLTRIIVLMLAGLVVIFVGCFVDGSGISTS